MLSCMRSIFTDLYSQETQQRQMTQCSPCRNLMNARGWTPYLDLVANTSSVLFCWQAGQGTVTASILNAVLIIEQNVLSVRGRSSENQKYFVNTSRETPVEDSEVCWEFLLCCCWEGLTRLFAAIEKYGNRLLYRFQFFLKHLRISHDALDIAWCFAINSHNTAIIIYPKIFPWLIKLLKNFVGPPIFLQHCHRLLNVFALPSVCAWAQPVEVRLCRTLLWQVSLPGCSLLMTVGLCRQQTIRMELFMKLEPISFEHDKFLNTFELNVDWGTWMQTVTDR